LRIVGCSKDRKVWRKLDRLAREAGIVELAATAGARSDLQRSRLPKKPREGKPPRGWSLARKILDAKGLPADYVPDRRNDLVREKGTDPHRAAPMPRSLLVQSQIRFAELEARKEQFREIAPAVRAYRDALLTKADPNEIDRLARALNAAKEKAGPLPEIPRPPSPRPATSPFWTAAVHDLHKLFEPFAAAWREKYIPRWGRGEEDAQSRKYATPGRLVRLILTALDPLEFLSATREDVRDRLR
jgi:hypothetical protein